MLVETVYLPKHLYGRFIERARITSSSTVEKIKIFFKFLDNLFNDEIEVRKVEKRKYGTAYMTEISIYKAKLWVVIVNFDMDKSTVYTPTVLPENKKGIKNETETLRWIYPVRILPIGPSDISLKGNRITDDEFIPDNEFLSALFKYTSNNPKKVKVDLESF